MLNTDSIVNKRIKVFVYIPENNGSGFLNGSGFVVFAYTFLTTVVMCLYVTLVCSSRAKALNLMALWLLRSNICDKLATFTPIM